PRAKKSSWSKWSSPTSGRPGNSYHRTGSARRSPGAPHGATGNWRPVTNDAEAGGREPMKRHVEFQRLHNFRDLGGYRASDSRTVPWQALYRSDSLGKLQGADWERFLGLGICTVIDLRYP